MVYNFLSGGAAINVFCRQNGLHLAVVDAGVNHNFADVPGLVHAKIGFGTKNFIKEPAMTRAQCDQALQKGADLVARLPEKNNCNVVGFGEMGIGNTSSAACIMSLLCDLPIDTCVGRGTGVDDAGLQRKRDLLAAAIAKFTGPKDAVSVLIYFGGFEIAMMCGAMLKAASLRMIVLVDGFVASAACLAAAKMAPAMLNYCFFAHRSHERGHTLMLDHLNAEPILDLQMRLGEGTGAALAYPILKAATCFLNEMASFDSAKVSQTTAEK
jgi:nicotinate-nucleotide--dimethylbenzimidazole phosphoribosyltransferase